MRTDQIYQNQEHVLNSRFPQSNVIKQKEVYIFMVSILNCIMFSLIFSLYNNLEKLAPFIPQKQEL